VRAAERALANGGVAAADVDCLLVATITHLKQTPAAAVEIAHRIGAGNAGAMDVSAACAGFSYALAVACDGVRAGTSRYVLVIGADRMTDIVDPTDRSTAFLFADGAGAVLVGPSHTPGIGPVVWGCDGTQPDAVAQDKSWDDWRAEVRADPDADWPAMRMHGQQVFRWVSRECVRVAEQAVSAAGLDLSRLDAFIPHQANDRLTDVLVKNLGLSDRVAIARDVVDQGNTSGASIPLAMERMLTTGQVRGGDIALLLGFGAGLTYAAQVVRLPAEATAGAPPVRFTGGRAEAVCHLADVVRELSPNEIGPVHLDTSFTADLGGDSLFVAEVATEIEDRLGVCFPEEILRRATTIRDLAEYLARDSAEVS
jgi:3-oxoacyl-(acyl-carrier-protein) synthase III